MGTLRTLPFVLLLGGCALFGGGEAPTDEEATAVPPSVGVEVPTVEVGGPRTDPDTLSDSKSQPYVFADVIEVNIGHQTHGVWSIWDETHQRWRVELHSPGAKSMNLHFGQFKLPAGAVLSVYNPAEPQALTQLTAKDNKPHGQLWTPQFDGDRLLLDLVIAPDSIPELRLELATVNAGFR